MSQNVLKGDAFLNVLRQGGQIVDKTIGIHESLILRICEKLLQVSKDRKDAYQERLQIILLYFSIGRGVEIQHLNFEGLSWIEENGGTLWANWNEIKCSYTNEIPFLPSNISFLMDSLHALVCHVITAGPTLSNPDPTEANWIFPNLEHMSQNAVAQNTTNILKSLVGLVEGLFKRHTSHGLRVGATDDALANELVDLVSVICLGNW